MYHLQVVDQYWGAVFPLSNFRTLRVCKGGAGIQLLGIENHRVDCAGLNTSNMFTDYRNLPIREYLYCVRSVYMLWDSCQCFSVHALFDIHCILDRLFTPLSLFIVYWN